MKYSPARPGPGDNQSDDRIAHYTDLEAPQRAMLALDAGRMGSWSWDIVKGTVVGDPFVASLLNLDYHDQPWQLEQVFSSMHPDDLSGVQAAVDHALQGADVYEVEFRDRVVHPETGAEGLRWLGARGKVTERDENGTALRMIGVNWDATEQKQTEEQLRLLAAEMDHRVKNAFAVMRALINIGQRSTDDKDNYAKVLKNQIEAMALAHALSAKMARETAAPSTPIAIVDILDAALAPWCEDGASTGAQVNIESEAELMIHPTLVSPLSMMIYELATNAAKYGALGERGGVLAIDLRSDKNKQIVMHWQEECLRPGPQQADDIVPSFGSTLIRHCVTMLKAELVQDVTENGLQMTLKIPQTVR